MSTIQNLWNSLLSSNGSDPISFPNGATSVTPVSTDSSTNVATTAFVKSNVSGFLSNSNAGVTGGVDGTSLVWDGTNKYPFFAYNDNKSGVSLATIAYVTAGYLPLTGGTISGDLTVTGTANLTAAKAQYADLAEIYEPDQEYVPGTVVRIGGEKEITSASSGDYFFGVISTSPGYLLNSNANGLPVALTGRVPVLVTGAVSKGDPIGMSSLDGIASVSTSYFGFALEDNDDTYTKLVEVAIGGR